MPSIKPEVHNVSQCRQRRIEPRPQGICTQKFVQIDPAVIEICSRTDRHTQTDGLLLEQSYPGRNWCDIDQVFQELSGEMTKVSGGLFHGLSSPQVLWLHNYGRWLLSHYSAHLCQVQLHPVSIAYRMWPTHWGLAQPLELIGQVKSNCRLLLFYIFCSLLLPLGEINSSSSSSSSNSSNSWPNLLPPCCCPDCST